MSSDDNSTAPTVSIEVIDASMANDILINHNSKNRKLNVINVRRLAAEMTAGEWSFNGDTICFDRSGMLFDGQHRLAAIRESSREQLCIIVRGVDGDEAQGTKDNGKKRSEGDHLVIMHQVDRGGAPAVAGACHRLARWERTGGRAVVVGAANKLSPRNLGEYYENNRDAVEYARAWMDDIKNKDMLIPKDELLFCAALILSNDADQGEQFLNSVFKGLGLELKTTTHVLNDQLTDWRNDFQRTKERKFTVAGRLLTVLRGWDYYRRGKNIKTRSTLVWRDGMDYPAIPFGTHTL